MIPSESKSVVPTGRFRWRTWLSWSVGAGAVVAVCVAARYFSPPSQASAQATSGRAPAAGQAPARVATNPRAPAATANAPAAATTRAAAGPAAPAANIVAVVNGQPITREELGQECVRRFGEEVLESVVNKQLIAAECQKRGIQITTQDVLEEVDRMAGKFGLSTERWLSLLQDERNISAEQYQREIIWPMLALRQLASTEIEVTADELRQAFESEHGPKIKARIIVASTKAEADQFLAMVKADPESFGDVAKNHSVDRNSASARGLIPPIRKHMGSPELEAVAFALPEGEISPVIEVANQFIILKCERKIPETFVAAPQLKEVEAGLRETIRDQKLRVAASDLFKRLQTESKVVNVLNNPQLTREMPGVAAMVNGRAISLQDLAVECLQRHAEDVLDGEINRTLLQQALSRKGLSVAEAEIDAEIRRAADAYGFIKMDGSPDVDAWLKHVTSDGGEHMTVDLYVRDAVWPSVALKKLVGTAIQVSEEELQKGFEANYGERVEVLAVVLNNQRRAQQVWEMARNNPTDQFFGDLATQYSVEPVSRANLGKVPPIRRFGGNDLVEQEAFKLQAGELSGVIAVADKYIILRCLGRTEPIVTRLDDVRAELQSELAEQQLRVAMAKEFDRLKETAKIQTYLTGVVTRGKLSQAAQTN